MSGEKNQLDGGIDNYEPVVRYQNSNSSSTSLKFASNVLDAGFVVANVDKVDKIQSIES